MQAAFPVSLSRGLVTQNADMPQSRTVTRTPSAGRPLSESDSESLLIASARAFIEMQGVDGLSLEEVATASGLAPETFALRFPDRPALINAVRDSLFRELASDLHKAESDASPHEAILGMGAAYRAFAFRYARVYQRVTPSGEDASSSALEILWPIIDTFRRLIGPDRALLATRTLISFLHGFAVMEANDNFQLTGSIDDTFEFGLNAVVDGIRAQRTGPTI
jgi:AcrR family transcriptional regulator